MSLDALRGFDMFWIVGADALVEGLRKLSDGPVIQGAAKQLEHVAWAGFHFEDLIFPMFVFIVGVSLLMVPGAVRGFAVVHCLGILTSMFSAVVVSRAIVNLVYGHRRRVAHLSIGDTAWK